MSSSNNQFPLRVSDSGAFSPSTSGGFYKYPKLTRSLKNTKSTNDPSTHLILLDSRRRLDTEITVQEKLLPSFERFDPKTNSRIKALKRTVAAASEVQPLPSLITSFSEILIPPPQFAEMEVQTVPELYQAEFSDLTAFTQWCKKDVDPFMKDLRKQLLSQRPTDVADYCLQYCAAVIMKRSLPETNMPPVEPEIDWSLIPEKPSENSVTGDSCLIRTESPTV